MKKIKLLIMLIALQACTIGAGENSKIEANKNNYFPKITGIDLDGEKQELPAVFNNKFNLVIVAFKREQQSEVDSWIKAIEPVLKENKNLNFYEIPLIYEVSTLKRMWVNNAMRLGIPSNEARKRTITVYTNREQFFKITEMQEDKIYALLINRDGKILWKREGVADLQKIQSLEKMIKS